MDFFPVNFSKIVITGSLHPSMPYIVLKELAFEMGLVVSVERLKKDVKYWAKIFKKLTKLEAKSITSFESDRDTIISIVNPLENDWTDKNLLEAFRHMIYYVFLDSITENDLEKIGPPTNENPVTSNGCNMYSYCKKNGISVPLDASYQDMKILIEHFEEYKKKCLLDAETLTSVSIQEEVISQQESPKPELDTISEDKSPCLNLQSPIPSPRKQSNFHIFAEIENLKSEANLLSDIQYLYQIVEPQNNLQAIIIGALTLSKDFSKYVDPLREFRRWKINLPMSFHDIQLKPVEKINPYYTDLNLYFNPYLPKNAYSNDMLNQHLALFSFLTFEYDGLSSYEILQELHLEENFHIGFHPNIINAETPVDLEPIDGLSNGDILCFGVREEILQATTWKELKEIFYNMNMFVNPFEKKRVFTKEQIERLSRIGRWILNNIHFSIHSKFKYLFQEYSTSTIENIKDCLDVIDHLRFVHQSNFDFITKMINEFNNKSQKQKDEILSGIEKLFEVTMLMRGWNKYNAYPIENSYPTDSETCLQRIIESIFELDEINDRTKDFIYKLPLMIWKNEFIQSVLEEQGLTIGDRIKIVKKGETDGVYSCVRMTSNVLGSSYCFYCRIFKLQPKFEIHKLSYIQ